MSGLTFNLRQLSSKVEIHNPSVAVQNISQRSHEHFGYRVTTKPADGLFECLHCPCKLACRSSLNRHVNHMHKKIDLYQCEVCHKGYSDRSNFLGHLASHSGFKRNVCTICQRCFAFKPALKAHFLRAHPGDLAFM